MSQCMQSQACYYYQSLPESQTAATLAFLCSLHSAWVPLRWSIPLISLFKAQLSQKAWPRSLCSFLLYCSYFFSNPHPWTCLLIFRKRGREEEREGKKHQCERETLTGCLFYMPWVLWPGTEFETWDRTHNIDQKSNQRPFGLREDAPTI